MYGEGVKLSHVSGRHSPVLSTTPTSVQIQTIVSQVKVLTSDTKGPLHRKGVT